MPNSNQDDFNYAEWEGSQYPVNVDLPANNGDRVTGSVVTREREFILHKIKHCVIGDEGDDPEQYSLNWSIQNDKRFWKGDSPPMARMFGSVHHGVWTPLGSPVKLPPKSTLYVELQNRYVPDGDPKQIQVIFEGLEYKGD